MGTPSSSTKEPHPSFFKVIRYPSNPHLAIPSAFIETHSKKMSRNPTLKTLTGNHSWNMEIEKIGENYCFAHGWDKLSRDAQLCARDILVFWLIDPKTIHVLFFDENGCQKDIPLINTNDVNNGVSHGDVDEDEDLCFSKVISAKTHRSAMSLPKTFVDAAGLDNVTSMKIIDHEGNGWTMRILAERYHRTKYSLSSGWTRFRRHHQLSDGDICFFKFNIKEGILNLTQLIKSKTSTTKRNMEGPLGNNGVQIEDECSPTDKPCGDRMKVKAAYESGREDEVKRKREGPLLKKHLSGGIDNTLKDKSHLDGGVKVKIEDEWGPEEVIKRKKERWLLEKPGSGSVVVKSQPEIEKVVMSKRVIFF